MNKLIYFLPLLFLIPLEANAEWYDVDYANARAINIDSSDFDSSVGQYPLYINMTSLDVGTDTQTDCDDILITDSTNSTKFSHEIETCDVTNDIIEIWVKVPTISSTSNTKIIMYYNNPSATNQEDITGVWDKFGNGATEYSFVYHMDSLSPLVDSTQWSNDLNQGGTPTVTDGVIENSVDYDGNSDYHSSTLDSMSNIDQEEITFSLWIDYDDTGVSSQMIRATTDGTTGSSNWKLSIDTNDDVEFKAYCPTIDSNWDAEDSNISSGWTHLAVTMDFETITNNPLIYKNGVLSGAINKTQDRGDETGCESPEDYIQGADNVHLAVRPHTTFDEYFDGRIDEVRFHKGILGAGWIKADYECQRPDGQNCIASVSAEDNVHFTVIPRFYESDGVQLVTDGSILQENATQSLKLSVNSTGQAKFTALDGNQNFTFITNDGFHVNKTINYSPTAYTLFDSETFIHRVSCPSNGSGDDVIITVNASEFTNGNDSHYISAQTTPSCAVDDDITWVTTETPNGETTGQVTTLVKAEILIPTDFGVNSDLFTTNSTTITTSYSSPSITSIAYVVGQAVDTLTLSHFLSLTNPEPPAGGEGGGGGGSDGGSTTINIIGTTNVANSLGLELIKKTHNSGLGQSFTSSITANWETPNDIEITRILVEDSPIGITFNETPFFLTGDISGVSTDRISYNISIPSQECTNVITMNCAEEIRYVIPISIETENEGETITVTSTIEIDLTSGVQISLIAVGLAVIIGIIGLFGGIGARRRKKRLSNGYLQKQLLS